MRLLSQDRINSKIFCKEKAFDERIGRIASLTIQKVPSRHPTIGLSPYDSTCNGVPLAAMQIKAVTEPPHHEKWRLPPIAPVSEAPDQPDRVLGYLLVH